MAHDRIGLKQAEAVKPQARQGLRSPDPDGDGLRTWTEVHRTMTNPWKFDTDGDGFGDGDEVRAGSDPRDPTSVPARQNPVPPSSFVLPSPFDPPPPSLDTTAPETTISSGPSGTTTSTSASFGFGSSESGSSFQCSLDSGAWSSCTSPKSYNGLAVGKHTFAVAATDAAGNPDSTPATRSWTITDQGGSGGDCTQTLEPGANLASAIASAPAGAVICLDGGTGWSFDLSRANKASLVMVRSADGSVASLSHSLIANSSNLGFSNLHFTGGLELIGATDDIQILDNEFSGEFGVRANGEDANNGTDVTNVLIEGNYLHDLDFSGEEGTAGGYGMTLVNGVEHFTIRDNTIKSVGNDYIQSASPVDFTVEGNTFLGPSLRYSHANVHQDLWQIFGGGREIAFTDNVARDTGTHESLLFQTGTFNEVRVENNLFDNDSDGYTCQIYPVQGLIFRDNTIVDSHWGCLFRTEGGTGTDYAIDHNVFVDTEENSDLSAPPSGWGTYDYNVSSDGSAGGTHSVRNWSPSWADSVNFVPQGLPIEAGYRP